MRQRKRSSEWNVVVSLTPKTRAGIKEVGGQDLGIGSHVETGRLFNSEENQASHMRRVERDDRGGAQ